MSEKTSSPRDGHISSPKARILLVDDQPANLLALQAILDDLGQELVLARSGEETLRRLREHDFAVVLLDVQLPGMSGFETAKCIREHERSKSTPIIFITAYDNDPNFSVRDAYALGAVDYLVKPLVPEILRAKAAVFVELFRRGEQVRDLERRERERAEKALRRSEIRFRELFEQSPLSIQVLAPDGRTLRVNRAWEELWGGTFEEHLRDYNVRHDPQLAELGLAPLIERAFAGEAVELPPVGYAPDRGRYAGQRRWVRAVMYPVKDETGAVAEVVLIHQDITERRRAEDAQRFLAEAGEVLASSLAYEETLSAVANLVVPRLADWCSVYVTDAEGRLRHLAVAHADPAKVAWARELSSRYPPDPNAPRGVAAVVRSGQPECVSELTDEMVRSAARDENHLAMLRGLGLKSVMMVPLSARGRNLGAVTFVAAESGRRYTEADLRLALDLGRRAGLAVDNARLFRETQETLRLLGLLVEASARLTGSLELPGVQAAILDLSRRLVAADAYAIWRRSPSEDEWTVTGSAGLSEEYLRAQGRIQSSAPMLERPIIAEDALGSAALESRRQAYAAEGIASVLAVPLRTHGGVSGTLVFYYRVRRRFDDLTVRVASALADLAGAALATAELYGRERESRQRAEEADRRKDEFLAMLAHELRNPLAPIRNSLHILRMTGGDWSVVEQVRGMMERQAQHLGRLVDDLLDVSRITLGKMQVRRQRLDLVQIARQSVEAHRPAFAARQVALRLDCPETPVWVSGDATRLAQVLDNLLTNALKFTAEDGEVDVTIAAEQGCRTMVSVRDTGVGIEVDMLPRLFETFSQADRTLDRSQGGLGLGLAIVKGLAELHGGTVRAESAGLGQGSVFTVTLPQEQEPAALASAPMTSGPAAGHLRVLVVEDSQDAADSLSLLLRLFGYKVTVAYSGPEGVRAAAAERPDVVICDIGLPGMDGYRVAMALRDNPATAAARLIALTGYGQEEDRRRTREAGFDEHLVKPADPAAVQRILAEVSAGRA
jgi:PAS domain S-box-containing protein